MRFAAVALMLSGCVLYSEADDAGPDAKATDAAGPALCPTSTWASATCVRTCRGGFAGPGAEMNECEGDCARRRYGVNYAPPCPESGLCDVGKLECEALCSTNDPGLTQRCGGTVAECVRACLALELGGAWSPTGCR